MALAEGTPASVPAPPQSWGAGGLPVPVSGGRPGKNKGLIRPENVKIWPCAPIPVVQEGRK
jgi:hypothetical protein